MFVLLPKDFKITLLIEENVIFRKVRICKIKQIYQCVNKTVYLTIGR